MFDGELLRRLREAKGWTRADLARATGLGESHIGKLERGERQDPDRDTVAKLAVVFGVSSDELFGRVDLSGVAINAVRDTPKPLTKSEFNRLMRQVQSIKVQAEKAEEVLRRLRPRFDGDGA